MTEKHEKSNHDPAAGTGPILVALDFTADSEAALLWACDYCASAGANLVVLHVVHDPGEAPGYYRQADADLLRPMEDVATEMMAEYVEKLRQEHPELDALQKAETQIIKGIPATRILEAAEATNAQLIVMGSRGRTGLPHLLLGSKAERVVQLSPIPVTIVKAGTD